MLNNFLTESVLQMFLNAVVYFKNNTGKFVYGYVQITHFGA